MVRRLRRRVKRSHTSYTVEFALANNTASRWSDLMLDSILDAIGRTPHPDPEHAAFAAVLA